MAFDFTTNISSPNTKLPALFNRLTDSMLNFKLNTAEIFSSIFEEDPECFAGHLIVAASQLIEDLSGVNLDKCDEIYNKLGDKVTDWEKRWYNAVCTIRNESARKGCKILIDMLSLYPMDLIAILIGESIMSASVDKLLVRDMFSRVAPYYDANHPYKYWVDSMLGFSLMETFSTERGEQMVLKAFDMESKHPLTIHNLCHALEYTGKAEKALELMEDNLEHYENTAMKVHNCFHIAYLQAEFGRFDEALDIVETKIIDSIDKMSTLSDTCGLLWSIKMADHTVSKSSFSKLLEKFGNKMNNHGPAFFAAHFAAAMIGAEKYDTLKTFRKSVNTFVQDFNHHDVVKKYENFGFSVMDSFEAYSYQDYSTAFAKIYDVEHEMFSAGGSQTQREIFNKLTYSCLEKTETEELDRKLFGLLNQRAVYRALTPSWERKYQLLSQKLRFNLYESQ
ncbi:tetratricopeptide repeat protein 38-like [Convolutriloba macropyga]|uniref:tetratricopeptide repeat protein 38-like n=1 Tax=Convolutriloba macropyga TaxID=536237 RepID=UPI003F5289B2